MPNLKTTTKEILPIYAALTIAASIKDLHPDVNYCIARNLKRLKKAHTDFHEENTARVKAYSVSFDKNGDPEIVDGQYDFGDKVKEAEEKYQELLNTEVNFEPYTIKQSEHTNKIMPAALAELLDIIVVE